MIYILDTNTISQIYRYRESFPSFWVKFDALVQDGNSMLVREVERELDRYGPTQRAVTELKQLKPGFFAMPAPEEQQVIREIFAIPHFRSMINTRNTLSGNPVADPFLVAKGCIVRAMHCGDGRTVH